MLALDQQHSWLNQAEVTDTAALIKLFQGQDAIIHAYGPPQDPAPRSAILEAREKDADLLKAIAGYQPFPQNWPRRV